ncbi:asparagine synthetase B [candidate division TA06 bacterium DG_26]|uniref:Asparagine synthetase B n=1 Tax=candidate division TA06 bacterium DG_26 TaxID=1703771 RepID=A0A0S7WLX5_UNCT6|nr:MAG: asparagine synthetase B [candidate division TA06 bacterium DG_26]
MRRACALGCVLLLFAFPVMGQRLLVYMDLAQTDHLKAYGVAYWALQRGWSVEWLLNYRGGSFMFDASQEIERICNLRGVAYSILAGSDAADIYSAIEENNMEVILLEKAPKIAVYIPPHHEPWDDAVALALDYAEVPYDRIWDADVLAGELAKYDWLHLHHEDFTGQFGKFYAGYRNADWYREEVQMNEKMARTLGFKKVSDLKLVVAKTIKEYVKNGGFLFAMCSATDTYDVALAADGIDIVPSVFDGDPTTPACNDKLNFENTLAFHDFEVELNAMVYEHSTIDTYLESTRRGPDIYFTLFEFSAKYDPVPTMLTQDHVAVINEFLGQCCGYHARTVKPGCIILGEVEGTDEIKYLHGKLGRGFFTFLGGHDPEDYAHRIGDPPTRLELHKNSPGYRLILNNILFPAAKKKELKT